MTNYGHRLQFGIFATPVAEPADHAVELAQVAEEAGLDLVTFQDHPYNPQFLDTWTLLAYTASKTRQIHLAGNVLNLPLRHPVELARSVATLDRLSGGRIELGLGAGAFWDGIGAMGGRKLTAGQSIEALAEGIERSAPSGMPRIPPRCRSRARTTGSRGNPADRRPCTTSVSGSAPTTPHPALTGRLATGCSPPGLSSRRPCQSVCHERGNRLGRHRRRSPTPDIRRMLNLDGRIQQQERGLFQGPPESWARQLVELNRDYGISTFILAADDPATIALFGTVIAPLVREAIAAA